LEFSPITLFVYRRPEHLRRVLSALEQCQHINDSVLYVFSDAPKVGANSEETGAVEEVRRIIRTIDWCFELVIVERPYNHGFQNHILGITEVVEKYERVIVLEDDIVVAPGFLTFMNQALDVYADDDDVMHVSAYMLPLQEVLPDTLFYNAANCWGWGTWRRAWRHFHDESETQLEAVLHHPKRADFDCPPYWYLDQLRQNANGAIYTWNCKWHASIFLRGGLCLHPGRTLVNNIGHDGTGENSVRSAAFNAPTFDRSPVIERIEKREYPGIRRLIRRHYGISTPGLWHRLRSRVGQWGKAEFGKLLGRLVPEIGYLRRNFGGLGAVSGSLATDSDIHPQSRLYAPFRIEGSRVGAYSYVAEDSIIKITDIGKFVSIGPGFRSGFGLHPVHGVSTSPAFYSVRKQCGATFSKSNKFVERKPIHIGNDVYIGINVTVLDGVTIGDGAVIGAGAVVTEDVPPYAIAVGVPAKVTRYRFEKQTIDRLLASKWWDGGTEEFQLVERSVFDVEEFLNEHERRTGRNKRDRS